MQIALLPAKPPHLAKTRLGTLLTAAEREAVSRAMFDDVLAALSGSHRLDAVLVVTADLALAERARAARATVVAEGVPRGLNGAVALGTVAAIRRRASTVVVVLSDIPLLTPADVDDMLDLAPRPGVLLVPSKEGTGTNAMVRTPGTLFPPRFGERSLERHVAAADRRGLPCELWPNARIGFDVDTPEDLRAFACRASGTRTYDEALRLGLATISSAPSAGRST